MRSAIIKHIPDGSLKANLKHFVTFAVISEANAAQMHAPLCFAPYTFHDEVPPDDG